jgi:hypothetical protein
MAESRRSVPSRFTAEQALKLVFSSLDRDISSEDELTSDEELTEENTEVMCDDTEDNVSSENEEYQVANVITSESEDEHEENQGPREYAGERGQLRGRGVLGVRGRGGSDGLVGRREVRGGGDAAVVGRGTGGRRCEVRWRG